MLVLTILLALYVLMGLIGAGFFLVRHILPTKSSNLHLVLAVVLGPTFTIGVLLFLSTFLSTAAYWVLLVPMLTTPLVLWKKRVVLSQVIAHLFAFIRAHVWFCLFTLACIASLASSLSLSWVPLPDGSLLFQQGVFHDMVWHVALTNQLMLTIPPFHPSTIGLPLTNYHYSLDLLVAAMSYVTHAPVSLLFFQMMPWLLSSQLALAVILCAKQLVTSGWKKVAGWSLFFVFFGGSFAFLLPLYGIPKWHESSFWVSQTFSMMVNPQLVLSFSLVLVGICLQKMYLERPTVLKLLTFLSIILILAGIKFYAVVFGVVSVAVTLLYFVLDHRLPLKQSLHHILVGGIFFAVGSVLFILPYLGNNKVSLFWSPLWYPRTMIEASDRVPVPHWAMYEPYFLEQRMWAQYLKIKFLELIIFIGGNTGTRIIALIVPIIGLVTVLMKRRFPKKLSFMQVQLWLIVLIGATLPLLFLQTGYVWNTIQFWYYTLIALSLLAGLACYKLSVWLHPAIFFLLAVVLVLLTIPTYIQTSFLKFTAFDIIDKQLIDAIPRPTSQSVTLICPRGKHASILYGTSFVQAVAPQRVYLANHGQLEIVGEGGEERSNRYLAGEYETLKNTGTLMIEGSSVPLIDLCPEF